MTGRGRSLVVFTRDPGAEACAKGFAGPDAAPLFGAFLDSWTDLARAANVRLAVSTPRECREEIARLALGRAAAAVRDQPDTAFGERLVAAVRAEFAAGAVSVVLVGGDGPAIRLSELEEAFRAVEAGELAVGPSRDGGVYLVGLGAADAPLLSAISAGADGIVSRLGREVEAAGRRCRRLPVRDEIDAPSDVRRVAARLDPLWSRCRSFLRGCLRLDRTPARCPGVPSRLIGRLSDGRAPPLAA